MKAYDFFIDLLDLPSDEAVVPFMRTRYKPMWFWQKRYAKTLLRRYWFFLTIVLQSREAQEEADELACFAQEEADEFVCLRKQIKIINTFFRAIDSK
jgi:hypothetical protein